ncbi:pyridoxamine 5'-phosphate oxidase family protein [Streptomyces sp. NPDC055186]
MTSRYAQVMFTPSVRHHQSARGSRASYATMERGPANADRLGPHEVAFVQSRTSFYLASTGSTGWPYVQHRGGPEGFLRALDDRTLAFADYRGNKQYITTGNLDTDDRVSLLLMDYPSRSRLKVVGRAHSAVPSCWPRNAGPVLPGGYRATVERILVIEVEAYDWNCAQHIEPRYTEKEFEHALNPLRHRLERLEAENDRLRAELDATRETDAPH